MEDKESAQLDRAEVLASGLQQNLSSIAAIKSTVRDTKDRKVPEVLLAAAKDASGNIPVSWNKGPGDPYPWNKK